MEECVTRLDISMFNSIVHSCKSNVSDDPISDAIFDSHVLPIPPGHLSFGSGAELKNVVKLQTPFTPVKQKETFFEDA